MSDVPGTKPLIRHLPHVTKGPLYTDFDGTYLIRCWEQFDTPETRPRGGKILEAWVPLEQIDEVQPTCLVCLGMGPGPDA
jgi:hypothetical protein